MPREQQNEASEVPIQRYVVVKSWRTHLIVMCLFGGAYSMRYLYGSEWYRLDREI